MCKAVVTERAQLRELAFKSQDSKVFDQFPNLAQKYYTQLKKVSTLRKTVKLNLQCSR